MTKEQTHKTLQTYQRMVFLNSLLKKNSTEFDICYDASSLLFEDLLDMIAKDITYGDDMTICDSDVFVAHSWEEPTNYIVIHKSSE